MWGKNVNCNFDLVHDFEGQSFSYSFLGRLLKLYHSKNFLIHQIYEPSILLYVGSTIVKNHPHAHRKKMFLSKYIFLLDVNFENIIIKLYVFTILHVCEISRILNININSYVFNKIFKF